VTQYFTQFAARLDLGTPDNVSDALSLYESFSDGQMEKDEGIIGFIIEADGDSSIRICDSESHGDPDHAVQFVLACAGLFRLKGRWGLTWSTTCSHPTPRGFSGGAQLVDLGTRTILAVLDCDSWLDAGLTNVVRLPRRG
jgi:hypothetical protein